MPRHACCSVHSRERRSPVTVVATGELTVVHQNIQRFKRKACEAERRRKACNPQSAARNQLKNASHRCQVGPQAKTCCYLLQCNFGNPAACDICSRVPKDLISADLIAMVNPTRTAAEAKPPAETLLLSDLMHVGCQQQGIYWSHTPM